MANSKYEYVKSFEVEDHVMPRNIIVIRVDGRNFTRFSEVHEFEKPNDERALNLMNICASALLEKYQDVVFAYGFDDEFSFVFKRTSEFYQRRASKILSIIVSFFTSEYVTKWKAFFPGTELRYAPSFRACIITCATMEVLQSYLAWRQNECHSDNQYNTCFWMLVKSGKTEKEAQEFLKGTQKQEKNELLFQQFSINYKNLPEIFRQGSCVVKIKVEEIVKYSGDGTPVKRPRIKPKVVHSGNIAGKSFWNGHNSVLEELGILEEETRIIRPEYVKSFQFENKLIPSTWIVVRIDGCHFHRSGLYFHLLYDHSETQEFSSFGRFSELHGFEKPNDEHALNLMNSCAVAVLKECQDIVFSYGVSDEYSFVVHKDSKMFQRRPSELVSVIVSLFSSNYAMKWNEYFPLRSLMYPPSFDGRAVCYPSSEILLDYLAWRQVDCHINNHYNTCFWMLVKSGKSKSEAQNILKGTQAPEKNELLGQKFNIDYNALPIIFRQGSSVFGEKICTSSYSQHGDKTGISAENGTTDESARERVVVEHCNIIEKSFWDAHPGILGSRLNVM